MLKNRQDTSAVWTKREHRCDFVKRSLARGRAYILYMRVRVRVMRVHVRARGEIFNLGHVKQNGRFDMRLLNI